MARGNTALQLWLDEKGEFMGTRPTIT